MAKSIVVAAFLLAATAGGAAYGQDNALVAPEISKPTPGHLLDQNYQTSTGATVPRPGVPQASGPTELDRKIQEEDNRLDNSICKGC
jgi:hypothetical protein